MKKDSTQSIDKDDFISFLAQATPDDVARLIAEKGKPRKLVDPLILFKSESKTKE